MSSASALPSLSDLYTYCIAPPPPPPPPPIIDVYAIVALAGIALTLLLIGSVYVSLRWDRWFEALARSAFTRADKDRSGTIDRDELYTGVLEMFLQLHCYGLLVRPPRRVLVMEIMEDRDVDQDGKLGYDEFKAVLTELTKLVFSRGVTQMGLTILCPMVAPSLSFVLRRSLGEAMLTLSLELPAAALQLGAHLPAALDETLLSTVLMLSVSPALNMVDNARQRERKAQLQNGGSGKTQEGPVTRASGPALLDPARAQS